MLGLFRNALKRKLHSGLGAGKQAAGSAAKASQATAQFASNLGRDSLHRTHRALTDIAGAAQGILASSLASDLNPALQSMVKGSATIYDKAMDAAYNATSIGGANHRLFDGGHALQEAIAAGHGASESDSILQETTGILQALLRDGTTTRGLPIATWDKATFEQVTDVLGSTVRIPKEWMYDLSSYDAAELLGGAVGTLAVAFRWNSAEAEEFGRIAGSLGLSSAMAANPALLVVTVAALARAFQKARETGDYAGLIDGQARGALGAGSALSAVALVGVAGGPAGVALLAGMTAGMLASKASKRVSVTQVGAAIADTTQAIARDVLSRASPRLPLPP